MPGLAYAQPVPAPAPAPTEPVPTPAPPPAPGTVEPVVDPPPPMPTTPPPSPAPAPEPAGKKPAGPKPGAAAAPAAEESRQPQLVGGAVALGLGGVGTILFGVSYARHRAALNDPAIKSYESAFGGNADSCRLARKGIVPTGADASVVDQAVSACNKSDVFKTLGVTSLSFGVALLATGAYLVGYSQSGGDKTPPPGDKKAPKVALSFAPIVSEEEAGVVVGGAF